MKLKLPPPGRSKASGLGARTFQLLCCAVRLLPTHHNNLQKARGGVISCLPRVTEVPIQLPPWEIWAQGTITLHGVLPRENNIRAGGEKKILATWASFDRGYVRVEPAAFPPFSRKPQAGIF